MSNQTPSTPPENEIPQAQSPTEESEKFQRARRRLYEPIVDESAQSINQKTPTPKTETRNKKAELETSPLKIEEPDISDTRQQLVRKREVEGIIQNYMILAMGVGVFPLPFVDTAALGVLQLKMLKSISTLYEVPYSAHKSPTYMASLLGAVVPLSFSQSLGSFLKTIPGFGSVIGAAIMPTSAVACTYAVGRVFTHHFELGGTLLDFDPDKAKNYFRQQYNEGRQLAKNLKTASPQR
ncbi:DUF697 domain-containing protein [Deltaproteobacteria bacterium TL4]